MYERIDITLSLAAILVEKSTQNGITMRDVMQTHCRGLFTCHGYHHHRHRHHRSRRHRRRRRRYHLVYLCEIRLCEKLENTVRCSLCLSSPLLYSMPSCVTIHFPTSVVQRSCRPTFLSYRQPFSPCRFAPLVHVRLYIQLHPPPPPAPPLSLSFTPLLSFSIVRKFLTHGNM